MPTKNDLINRFVNVLQSQVGVRESDDNSGATVRQYQGATTLGGSHWPWCVALDAWALREVGKKFGIEIPWSYSASCDVVWADGKARGIIRTKPQKGDIGLVRAKKGNGFSNADAIHGFGVVDVVGDTVHTIEGNSNNDGGREGIGVFEHQRPISERLVWVRWIDGVELAETAPVVPWKVRVKVASTFVFLKPLTENGTNYISAAELAAARGVSCTWNGKENSVILDGREIGTQPRLIGGRSFFTVWVLAEHLGLKVVPDGDARVVSLG